MMKKYAYVIYKNLHKLKRFVEVTVDFLLFGGVVWGYEWRVLSAN